MSIFYTHNPHIYWKTHQGSENGILDPTTKTRKQSNGDPGYLTSMNRHAFLTIVIMLDHVDIIMIHTFCMFSLVVANKMILL
jgi:hypothetical protein